MLGRTLGAILTEQDRTRKWLSKQVGNDPATASRMVAGLLPINVDQLARMAKALGVTRRVVLDRAGYLENNGTSTLDLDTLPPMARKMVLAAVRAALDVVE